MWWGGWPWVSGSPRLPDLLLNNTAYYKVTDENDALIQQSILSFQIADTRAHTIFSFNYIHKNKKKKKRKMASSSSCSAAYAGNLFLTQSATANAKPSLLTLPLSHRQVHTYHSTQLTSPHLILYYLLLVLVI